MAEYQYVVRRESSVEETVSATSVLGKKVLSKGGSIVGYVRQLRVNPETLELEGVVVKKFFKKPMYIGKSYFATLSASAIILNVELSLRLQGKRVVTQDGKILGRVVTVNRRGKTNDLESLLVRSLWRVYSIPASAIKQVQTSVLITYTYGTAKNHLWKRSKQNDNL